MSRNAALFALALCAALLLPGCVKKETPSSPAPVSSPAPISSAASGQEETGAPQSASSRGESSTRPEPSSAAPGTPVQNGPLKTIRTDNEKFNGKFQKNPLDAAYMKEMNGAVSTAAMADVCDKYAGLWQKEVPHAYESLRTALSTDSTTKWRTIEAGQKQWESGTPAALEKIASDAAAAGGSIARVEAASGRMDYYRDRAAALYRSLYDLRPDYGYAYK